MDNEEFRKYAHNVVDWMADYLEAVEKWMELYAKPRRRKKVAEGELL